MTEATPVVCRYSRRSTIVTVVSLTTAVVLAAMSCHAEIVQVRPVETRVEADPSKERPASELVQIESAKRFIVEFISAWDPGRKFKAMTKRYQSVLKSPDRLKVLFDKESYDRLELLRFAYASTPDPPGSGRQLTVKVNVHWFLEGHDGVSTYYFMLTRERGGWLVDWLVR